MLLNFWEILIPPKKINFKENFLSLYTFTNEGLVMEGNIIKKMT